MNVWKLYHIYVCMIFTLKSFQAISDINVGLIPLLFYLTFRPCISGTQHLSSEKGFLFSECKIDILY